MEHEASAQNTPSVRGSSKLNVVVAEPHAMLGVEVLLDRLDDVCLGAQEVSLSDAIKLQFSRSFDHFLAKLIQRSSGWANITCTARLAVSSTAA
jgi:hypothetical protein